MDASATQIVTDIVRRRSQAGESFTAFDVTTEARAQGAFVRHGEARDLVHRLFQAGDMGAAYQRSVVDLGNGARPFVYHRFDTDPAAYQSSASGASPQPPRATQPVSTAPSSQATDQGGGLIRKVMSFFSGGGSQATIGPVSLGSPDGGSPSRVRRKTLDLDASAFLPISRDEMMRSSRTSLLWSGVWFWRRDMIPPASDRRTMLIDRGMLSAGLLSAEQLAEFHRIGDLYAKFAKDAQAIRHNSELAGQAAVEADRQERARLRQQKKQEAEQRRAERRAAIEHRRLHDIVFLGRGVSAGLADRQSDEVQLTAAGLPVLSTPADVADAMGLSIPELRWLAFHNRVATRTHYVSFSIAKKSGGTRQLSTPHAKLKATQTWILENVLANATTHEAAHGFARGRSTITGAHVHVGQHIVLNADLENFFPSIHWTRVRKAFRNLGYSPAVATIFALLCTETPRREVQLNGQIYFVATGERGLPQGACTSPVLSNLVSFKLDRRLAGLAAKFALRYTRYADDLTFSGGDDLGRRMGYIMAKLRHIASDEGFAINEKKTRVQRRHQRQNVTGLVVNDRVGVSRPELRRLRAILHRAQFEGLEAQNREQHSDYRGYLTGMIAYVAATRPELAAQLRKQLAQVPA